MHNSHDAKSWQINCYSLGEKRGGREEKMNNKIGCQFLRNLDLLMDLGKINGEVHLQAIKEHIDVCDECRHAFGLFHSKYITAEAEVVL